MRSSDIPEIRSLRLFESMSDSAFESLMQAAYLQTFPAQLDLIREGDPADFLYVLTEGCVEMYARTGQRETTMGMVWPVGAFILAAVLKDAVNLMSAR
ncbi:MAG: cyclic nucleotide-binding domain-containing protein, partial [Notoacmeibacter sp.]|nr:cyclic nucleotide-binding domain-containing protein [Notoacmeibacter sp.]